MAYPALNIACYFVNQSLNENVPITNMKLQKMVYIANGLNLARNKEPLIIERVEVWAYGPVIKPIYDFFKIFGADNINRNLIDCELFNKINPTEKDKEILDATWELCKPLDGIQLSNWTHIAESPWTKSFQDKKSFISDDLLEQYFKQFLKAS